MRYTRYADDLFFSSDALPGENLLQAIARAVKAKGFAIQPRKSRVMGPNERRMVTGLSVARRAQPQRKLRRALRARFHQAGLRPEAFVKEVDALSGWASYVKMYDSVVGSGYVEIASRVRSLSQAAYSEGP